MLKKKKNNSLDPLPVSQVSFRPLWRTRKGTELTSVRNATPGLLYHLQSVGVQLPRHLQPKELLHFLDFVNNRATVLSSNKLLYVFFKVVEVF
jgi:hypothetical protein